MTLQDSPVPSLDERILRLLPRVRYRRALEGAERESIFRLRYAAYLREGAIAPNALERFTDPVDDASNCHVLGVYIDGELASSMRLCVSAPETPAIPTAAVFPDILEPLIEDGRIIVDPTRFVADRELSRRYPELPYLAVRGAWMAAEHMGADLLLAAVRPEHQPFYRRLLGHQPMCGPRPYPNLAKPVALMGLNVPQMREQVLERHPSFRSTVAERISIFGPAPYRRTESYPHEALLAAE